MPRSTADTLIIPESEHPLWQAVSQLRAENERLKAELKSIDGALDDPRANLTLTTAEIIWELKAELAANDILFAEHIAGLKAELAEAKKDAEILQWLFGYTPAMLYVLFDANNEKELRAGIEAAMKGK